MTTLVTGATGTVGSHVIRTLTEKGVKPRAFVRDQTKATGLQGQDVEVAIGDYGNPDSLPAALDGVEHLFLTCANHPSQVAWETAMVDAAAAAGVRRIVKLSALGAEIGSPVAFFDAHGRIEAHLRGAGVPSVVLQPAFKMSNLLAGAPTVKEADAFMLPGAGAKVAMIDPRCGAVCCRGTHRRWSRRAGLSADRPGSGHLRRGSRAPVHHHRTTDRLRGNPRRRRGRTHGRQWRAGVVRNERRHPVPPAAAGNSDPSTGRRQGADRARAAFHRRVPQGQCRRLQLRREFACTEAVFAPFE